MRRSSVILVSLILMLSASAAFAQEDNYKYEFKAFWGYTISPKIDVAPQTIAGNVLVNTLSPRSSFSYGLQFDYNFKQHWAVGALLAPQLSHIIADTVMVNPNDSSTIRGVPGYVSFADSETFNVHGVVTYNFGSTQSHFRPFVLAGPGISRYSPAQLSVVSSGYTGSRVIDGATNFSPTFGGGVKAYVTGHFGLQLMGRYTPTRISKGKIWCGDFWGCFQNNSQFAQQIELTGGILVRF